MRDDHTIRHAKNEQQHAPLDQRPHEALEPMLPRHVPLAARTQDRSRSRDSSGAIILLFLGNRAIRAHARGLRAGAPGGVGREDVIAGVVEGGRGVDSEERGGGQVEDGLVATCGGEAIFPASIAVCGVWVEAGGVLG